MIARFTSVIIFLIATAAVAAPPAATSARPPHKAPRLILQITVDQLRGDLPFRYRDEFGDGGFKLFLDHGIWYADAQHPHAQYETAVGHTTLATGAWPSRHGIISNSLFSEAGVSPDAIMVTTFSDELTITTNGASKVFAVSAKDRGAVPLAGHAGKAFWYSDKTGCYDSSTFYFAAPPQWVTDWCATHPADRWANTNWELLHAQETYLFHDVTNVYPKGSVAEQNMLALIGFGFGRTFPHPLGSGRTLYRNLMLSPQGDELTADFAMELMRHERLGHHRSTDYLAISFSMTDFIAHWFSPTSLESEDNLLRLDRTLRRLFAFVDATVGLDQTLIVLSADHGGPEYPEYLATLGVPTGRLTTAQVREAAANALARRYPSTNFITSYSPPYFFLDHSAVEAAGLPEGEVEAVIAEAVMDVPGIAFAVPTVQLLNGGGRADQELLEHLRRNYYPRRSGDVYVVPQAQWQLDDPQGINLLQHSTPWEYNAYVPVAFAGSHLPHSMIYRPISTTDVAATLASWMKTKFPSGNVGAPLSEVLGKE